MVRVAPMLWRKISDRYNLMGSHCQNCKNDYFPQRKFCPKCRRKGKIVQKKMPSHGKVMSWTKVFAAPMGFEMETPYYLAIIELDNGVRLMSQLVDSKEAGVKTGAKVQLAFRRVGEGEEEGLIGYGFKFKVV
jgi:uncharacterized OB-fold protein